MLCGRGLLARRQLPQLSQLSHPPLEVGEASLQRRAALRALAQLSDLLAHASKLLGHLVERRDLPPAMGVSGWTGGLI